MRTQLLHATVALGVLSLGGCHKSPTSFRRSPQELDQLEKAPARTIAQVPASHEVTEGNNLGANDLVHGDGSQRLSVVRRWSGAETTNTHFGKGWADENVFRLTQIDAGTVLLWRGGRGWRTANGTNGKFTTGTGETIERAGAEWKYRSKNGAALTFDESGKLISETSAFSVTRNYSYDASGRLTSVGDGAQNSLRYNYDKQGRVTKIEGPEGLRSVYRYDDAGLLIGVTNSANVQIEYRYDNSGALASVKDQFGRQTEMAKLPTPTETSDALKSPLPGEIERDEHGVVKAAVIRGEKVSFRYDKQGALESLDSPAGSTSFKHDAFGRLIESTEPGDGRTRFEFNNLDLPTLVAAANGSSERLTYNKYGMPVRRERSASDWEEFVYDTNARLVAIRSAPTAEEKLSYNDQDQLVGRKTAGGAEATYGYDLRGNLVTESWSTGEKISRVHNAKGQLAEVVASSGLRTQFVYDDKGRLVESSDPVHGKVSYKESSRERTIEREGLGKFSLQLTREGAPLSFTNPAGGRTTFQLDGNGRPIVTIAPDQLATTYSYDKAHHLTGITSPGGMPINLKCDALGRVTDVVRGDIVWRQFRYDSKGRIAEAFSATGSAAKYGYDESGRLAKIVQPSGDVAVSYDKDTAGRTINGKDYELGQEFRPDGTLVRQSNKTAKLDLRFPLDERGRAAGLELNEIKVGYGYDVRGQVERMTLPSNKAIQLTRDEAGRITKIALGSAATVDLTYDRADRITGIKGHHATGTDLLSETYTFDPAGNVSEIKMGGGAQRLEYDKVDRLKKVSGGKSAQEFHYDVGGNLSAMSSARWFLDKLGRPLQQGPTRFTWDAAGNLARAESGLTRGENMFDAAGRLTQRKRETATCSYGYLPEGDRLWRESSKGRAWFAYTDKALTAYKDENGTSWLLVNLPGTDWPVALCGSNGKTFFVVADRLHSTRRILDEAGNTIASIDFGPFGKIEQQSGDAPILSFAGMILDEGGLFYARQRYYDPALARFISIDPLPGWLANPASHNAYSYALNNPNRYRDPQGTEAIFTEWLNHEYWNLSKWTTEELKLFYREALGTAEEYYPAAHLEKRGLFEELNAIHESVYGVQPAPAPQPRVRVGGGAAEAVGRAETLAMQGGAETISATGRANTIVAIEAAEGMGGRVVRGLRFLSPVLVPLGLIMDAKLIYDVNSGFGGMVGAAKEGNEASAAAKAMRFQLAEKIAQIAANDPGKIVMKMPGGEPFDPKNPAHVEELLSQMHSNITKNRKPLEGIVITSPSPEDAQALAAALAKARALVTTGNARLLAVKQTVTKITEAEAEAQSEMEKARTAAVQQGLFFDDVEAFPLAVQSVNTNITAVKGQTQTLGAAEKEFTAAITACEKAEKQTCDFARQSEKATEAQVKAWQTEANSLIFSASNTLNAAQEKIENAALASEELRTAEEILRGYQVKYTPTQEPRNVAGAASSTASVSFATAKAAWKEAGDAREQLKTIATELRGIPPQVRNLLLPFLWSLEAAPVIAEADDFDDASLDGPPKMNLTPELNEIEGLVKGLAANKAEVEEMMRKANVAALITSANTTITAGEAALTSARAIAANPDRYWPLQRASKCFAEIKAVQPVVAATSPTPLPSSSAKPTDDEVTVPNVTGLEGKEAKQELEKLGLAATFLGSKEKTSKELEFKVASQEPLADAKVKRGSPVGLAVYAKFSEAGEETAQSTSSPTPSGDDLVTVPNVKGLEGKEAKQTLEKLGLSATFVGAQEKTSKALEFKVAHQDRDPGTTAKRGTVVVLAIYGEFSGSEETAAGTVPDVVGMEIRAAQAKIEAAGLKLAGVESGTLKPPTPDQAYRIYAQTPKAGEAPPSDKFVFVKEYGSGKGSEPEPAPSVSLGSGGGDFEGQWVGVIGADGASKLTMTFTIQRTGNGYAVAMVSGSQSQPFQRTRVEGDRLICEADTGLAKGSTSMTVVYRFQRQGDDLAVDGSWAGRSGRFEPMGRLKRK